MNKERDNAQTSIKLRLFKAIEKQGEKSKVQAKEDLMKDFKSKE